MARSAAALIYGFENFDPGLRFAGVIFNQLGSSRHLTYLKEALAGSVRMPCLGGMLRNADIAIPERHLGLMTHHDHLLSVDAVNHLADFIESSVDMDALLAGFSDVPTDDKATPSPSTPESGGLRIGVAMDQAFCFYYPDNLDALTREGAQLVPFSPIIDARLPENIAGIYLGGGYPELHAEKLAANAALRYQIRELSLKGMPIYAECGGLMYLCRELTDLDGLTYPMTGCFSFATRMLDRLKTLGYREISLRTDTILGRAGQIIRGHEFHYSEIVPPAQAPQVYAVTTRSGQACVEEGFQINNTLGSYIHLHFGSQPHAAPAFVQACAAYRNRQEHHDTQ
jgi:cobyrinic acid a,c-diamide synthase